MPMCCHWMVRQHEHTTYHKLRRGTPHDLTLFQKLFLSQFEVFSRIKLALYTKRPWSTIILPASFPRSSSVRGRFPKKGPTDLIRRCHPDRIFFSILSCRASCIVLVALEARQLLELLLFTPSIPLSEFDKFLPILPILITNRLNTCQPLPLLQNAPSSVRYERLS